LPNPLKDPRPDIEKDSKIWESVFLEASKFEDKSLLGTLRGFRSAGSMLEVEENGLIFKFDPTEAEFIKKIIKIYALDYKHEIKEVFKKVAADWQMTLMINEKEDSMLESG